MSATELHHQYQTFHDEVQGWLDQEFPIQRALDVVAGQHEVSIPTVRRAYYHIKNKTHHPTDTIQVCQQSIQEPGILINLNEARKRRRTKRMVKL